MEGIDLPSNIQLHTPWYASLQNPQTLLFPYCCQSLHSLDYNSHTRAQRQGNYAQACSSDTFYDGEQIAEVKSRVSKKCLESTRITEMSKSNVQQSMKSAFDQ